jgi:hypothetical protein
MDKCLWECFSEWKDAKLLCIPRTSDDEIQPFNWREEFLKRECAVRCNRLLGCRFHFSRSMSGIVNVLSQKACSGPYSRNRI